MKSAYIVKELLHYCNVFLKYATKIESAPISYYDFTFVLKGEMTYIVDGKKYILRENDALLIKPGSTRERIKTDSPIKYVSFNFRVFDDEVMPRRIYMPDVISHEIKTLVSVFAANHVADIYSTKEKVVNLLNYILLELKDIIDLESNNKHIIAIIKYINEHTSEPITLSTVSEKINLSKEYTSHIFKRETGKTVTDYINERKLMVAKEMIQSTNYQLTEICSRLGYENYSYFSKVFKARFGVTPASLRK